MNCPQERDKNWLPIVTQEPPGKRQDEEHVAKMKEQVDPVVSHRLDAIPEDCVVEEVAERSYGTVETTLAVGPPVCLVQDQAQVLSTGLTNARILEEQAPVVEHEPGVERVRVCEQRDDAETDSDQDAPAASTVRTLLSPCRLR